MLEGAISMIIYRSAKPAAYVYICTHVKTRQFYIGYREKNVRLNRTSDIDLPLYRTSSNYVNPIFDEFEWQIVAEFFNGEWAYEFEQILIKENWGNPLLINKYYRTGEDKKFSSGGRKVSEETRKKQSKAKQGRIISEEHRQKISEANKGKTHGPRSEEVKQMISKANKGRKKSKETIQKLNEANKGKGHPCSEETKKKLREANRGKTTSDETKQKISNTLKERLKVKKELEDNQH